MSYIFISYAKQDIKFALHLKNLLKDEGFTVWIDEQQTSFNANQWPAVKRIIGTCAAYIIIMSPDSQKSRHVQNELAIAQDLRKPTFPILLSGKLNAILAELGYADMTGGLNAALPARLLRDLQSVVPTNKDVTPPQLDVDTVEHPQELTPEIMLPMARVLLIFVGLIIIVFVFINNRDDSPNSVPTLSVTQTEGTVAAAINATNIGAIALAESTQEFNPEATINARMTLTREVINTQEAETVANLQATQDIIETATYEVIYRETQISLDLTATAAQWTETPTANPTSTSTSTATETQIPTATHTLTTIPTNTNTLPPTNTHTPSKTPLPTQTPLPTNTPTATFEYEIPYGWIAGTTLYVQHTIGLSESAGFEPTDPVQYKAGDAVIVGVGLVAPWTYREWYIDPETGIRWWAIESGGGGWLPENAVGEKSP